MIIGFHYICYYVGCKLNEKVPNDLTNINISYRFGVIIVV